MAFSKEVEELLLAAKWLAVNQGLDSISFKELADASCALENCRSIYAETLGVHPRVLAFEKVALPEDWKSEVVHAEGEVSLLQDVRLMIVSVELKYGLTGILWILLFRPESGFIPNTTLFRDIRQHIEARMEGAIEPLLASVAIMMDNFDYDRKIESSDESKSEFSRIYEKFKSDPYIIYSENRRRTSQRMVKMFWNRDDISESEINIINGSQLSHILFAKRHRIPPHLISNYLKRKRERDEKRRVENNLMNSNKDSSGHELSTSGDCTGDGLVEDDSNCNVGEISILLSKRRTFAEINDKLNDLLVGQKQAVKQVSDALGRSDIFPSSKKSGPKMIFTFMGPPGVGKTMMAESIALIMNEVAAESEQDGYKLKVFDMASLIHRTTAEVELLGTDNSFQRPDEGALTGFVNNNPKSVLLFDEVEKAHQNAHKILLRMLDRGVLTDKKTEEEVDFSECIIVFTTNLGRNLYSKEQKGLLPRAYGGEAKPILLDALSERRPEEKEFTSYLMPEFISRLSKGEVILFRSLQPDDYFTLLHLVLQKVSEGLVVDVGPASLDWRLLLLLHFGPELDARKLSAGVESWLKGIIYHVFDEEGDYLAALEEKGEKPVISFAELPDENPVEQVVHKLKDQFTVLLIEDEDELVEGYRNALGSINLVVADDALTAEKLMQTEAISMALIDMHIGMAEDSSEMTEGLRILEVLRKQDPLLPVFGYSEIFEERGLSQDDLVKVMKSGGLRDVSPKPAKGVDDKQVSEKFLSSLDQWTQSVLNEKLIQAFMRRNRNASFETVIEPNRSGVVLHARNIKLETAVRADDMGSGGVAVIPEVSFDDIAGARLAKERLQEIVHWMKSSQHLRNLGVKAPKGILLYGLPGTGKTLLAKAVAGEAGLVFLTAVASDFHSLGAIRELFEKAERYAPSIIFLDEIDAIGGHRAGGGNALLNELLVCMDGFSEDEEVFVMAATNLPESLDSALIRPGRFDNKIEVELPDFEARKEILGIHLRGVNVDDSLDLHALAKNSSGMSGAELAQVTKEAGLLALREEKTKISQGHLLEAVNVVMMGMALKHHKSDADDLKRTAIHEAGHAIAGHLLEPHRKLIQVTIMPRANALGFAQHETDESGDSSLTEQELINRVKVLLAGRAAEALMLPKNPRSTGASNDLERASSIILKMLVSFGMLDRKWQGYSVIGDLKLLPESLMIEVNGYLEKFEQEVGECLQSNQIVLEKFSTTLLEKETLKSDQIEMLLAGHKKV